MIHSGGFFNNHNNEFLSTEHLSPEAITAYVDNQLIASAKRRSDTHLLRCRLCRNDIFEQIQARALLKSTVDVGMPQSLLGTLQNIPQNIPENREDEKTHIFRQLKYTLLTESRRIFQRVYRHLSSVKHMSYMMIILLIKQLRIYLSQRKKK